MSATTSTCFVEQALRVVGEVEAVDDDERADAAVDRRHRHGVDPHGSGSSKTNHGSSPALRCSVWNPGTSGTALASVASSGGDGNVSGGTPVRVVGASRLVAARLSSIRCSTSSASLAGDEALVDRVVVSDHLRADHLDNGLWDGRPEARFGDCESAELGFGYADGVDGEGGARGWIDRRSVVKSTDSPDRRLCTSSSAPV